METEKKPFKSEAPEYTLQQRLDKIASVAKDIEEKGNDPQIEKMRDFLSNAYNEIYQIYGTLEKE